MDLTGDGYPITKGDIYWDNNLDKVIVGEMSHEETNQNGASPDYGKVAIWYQVTKVSGERAGIADGSRLAKFHPITRECVSCGQPQRQHIFNNDKCPQLTAA